MKTKNIGSIEGYEQFSDYSVTSDGNVISHKFGKERVLKALIGRCGYLYINLCNEGTRKKTLIHILVARAFVAGYKEGLEVNHKDEVKHNNNYKNLEWLTHLKNIRHGTGIERRGKTLSEPIAQLTLEGKLVKIWKSGRGAGRVGVFEHGSISKVCHGTRKTHAGFKWKLVE